MMEQSHAGPKVMTGPDFVQTLRLQMDENYTCVIYCACDDMLKQIC